MVIDQPNPGLTIAEAASFMGVSTFGLRKMIGKGRVDAIRVDGKLYVTKTALRTSMERRARRPHARSQW
jgi:excisionase family DNA binding protein